MGKVKVAVFGLAGALFTGVVSQVTSVCPDLISQWPAILTAGVVAGVGFWLKSPKE